MIYYWAIHYLQMVLTQGLDTKSSNSLTTKTKPPKMESLFSQMDYLTRKQHPVPSRLTSTNTEVQHRIKMSLKQRLRLEEATKDWSSRPRLAYQQPMKEFIMRPPVKIWATPKLWQNANATKCQLIFSNHFQSALISGKESNILWMLKAGIDS